MTELPDITIDLVPPQLYEYPDMEALAALVGTPEGRLWVDRRWEQHISNINAKPVEARNAWEVVELQKPNGWLFSKLKVYYRDAVKGQGAVKRQYHFTAKADGKVARMYAGERTGSLRSLLFYKAALNLDMVNCQPTVMYKMAQKLG
jgi:hypothetical protein